MVSRWTRLDIKKNRNKPVGNSVTLMCSYQTPLSNAKFKTCVLNPLAELPVPGIYRLDAQLVKMLAQVPVTVLPVLPATLTLTLDKINFKALI